MTFREVIVRADRETFMKIASTTKFIDQMQNYAQLRKGQKSYGSNKLKLSEGQRALPGAVEPEKRPESLVHDVVKIIYPGLPDDIYDALQTMSTFSALRDASYSIMTYNDALGNEKTGLHQPDEKAIEAFDKLEAYRLSTGRTIETTTLLEVL